MKLKIVAIITVFMLLVISVPVYADTTIPNPPYDGMVYWVICDHPNHGITLLKSNNPITKHTEQEWLLADGGHRYYSYEGNQWILVHEGSSIAAYFENIYASNHDIAYQDGSGFFFFRPKVPQLYPVTKIVDFGTILRTFSVGLIPIVGLIVLALSLRKAWEFLQGQLTT